MPIRNVEEYASTWIKSFKANDVDALVRLYEPDATLIVQPGQTVSGSEAIRAALKSFVGAGRTLEGWPKSLVQAGDLALGVISWTLGTRTPEGGIISTGGTAANVLRRQPDGTWLIAIHNLYGTV